MGQTGHRLPHHCHLGRLDQLILRLQQVVFRLLSLHHLCGKQPVFFCQLPGTLSHQRPQLSGRQLLPSHIRDGDNEPVSAPLLEPAQVEVQETGLTVSAGGNGALTVAQREQLLPRLELGSQHGLGIIGEYLPQRLFRFDHRLLKQGQGTGVDRFDGAIGMTGN